MNNALSITFLKSSIILSIITIFSVGCVTETHKTTVTHQVQSYQNNSTNKIRIALGTFDNKSSYMQGLFTENNNALGSQARTILKSHLQRSNMFDVLDRENLSNSQQEIRFSNTSANTIGAQYLIAGDVTEFGRKNVGDTQLFGILGAGKKQVAYAKVSINVVEVATSKIVYSTQGAGEYALDSRQVLGFGGSAGYDSTLNGKVLDFAIAETVNKMTHDMRSGIWRAE